MGAWVGKKEQRGRLGGDFHFRTLDAFLAFETDKEQQPIRG